MQNAYLLTQNVDNKRLRFARCGPWAYKGPGQDETSSIGGLKLTAQLAAQYPNGMLHSKGIVRGATLWKKLGPIRSDATTIQRWICCSGWTADPVVQTWTFRRPRKSCHFTQKNIRTVAGAARSLAGQRPQGRASSYCPNYEKPVYTEGSSGVICDVEWT